jgi:hypothetical protein
MHGPIVVISIMFELNGLQIRLFSPSEIAGKFSPTSAILTAFEPRGADCGQVMLGAKC